MSDRLLLKINVGNIIQKPINFDPHLSPLTKDPPKFLSSASIRDSIVISVYNFTAQKRASFENQSILNFRVMEVRDTSLRSNLLKKTYS